MKRLLLLLVLFVLASVAPAAGHALPRGARAGHSRYRNHVVRVRARAIARAAAAVTVPAAPLGPEGSWRAVFADGFAFPVGEGGDTAWHVKTNSKGCCGNGNETSSEVASAVHWSEGNGLELRCEGLACSGVSSSSFTYQLGRGASFAFEFVLRLPYGGVGGEDPGWWSISTSRWPPELDFGEWWAWGTCGNPPVKCIAGLPVYKSAGLGTSERYFTPGESGWTQLHRYTTVVEGSAFREYVDGHLTGSFSQSVNTDTMNLILTHAIRESTAGRSSSLDVRSVAVYEDAAHAGQFVSGGGVAPGTTVGGGGEELPKEPPAEVDLSVDREVASSASSSVSSAESALSSARQAVSAAQSAVSAAERAVAAARVVVSRQQGE